MSGDDRQEPSRLVASLNSDAEALGLSNLKEIQKKLLQEAVESDPDREAIFTLSCSILALPALMYCLSTADETFEPSAPRLARRIRSAFDDDEKLELFMRNATALLAAIETAERPPHENPTTASGSAAIDAYCENLKLHPEDRAVARMLGAEWHPAEPSRTQPVETNPDIEVDVSAVPIPPVSEAHDWFEAAFDWLIVRTLGLRVSEREQSESLAWWTEAVATGNWVRLDLIRSELPKHTDGLSETEP